MTPARLAEIARETAAKAWSDNPTPCSCGILHADMRSDILSALTLVAREVWEEAMSILCGGCEQKWPVTHHGHSNPQTGERVPCMAAAIRARAKALK
jgi:hypothetical protein